MKKIQLFLGGGVKLLHGEGVDLRGYRNEVIDPVISQLNSAEQSKYFFIAKDYSDLTRHVVKGGTQKVVYNRYILKEADIALFILDGNIGNITREEIDVAVKSAKKSRHPLVFIYGIDINIQEELKEYLTQEGVYYQHFTDKNQLIGKIKDDLISSEHRIHRRRLMKAVQLSSLSVLLLAGIAIFAVHGRKGEKNVISQCSAQLYLMRYKDVNIKADTALFDEKHLGQFKYEDSVLDDNDRFVFPLYSDSSVHSSVPVFRIKLNNKHRNTIVLIEAVLEIDNYQKNTSGQAKPLEHVITSIPNIPTVNVDAATKEYPLDAFRKDIAYGEIDDRYAFAVDANEDCSFRMRVRAQTHTGEYLYTNYITVNFKR